MKKNSNFLIVVLSILAVISVFIAVYSFLAVLEQVTLIVTSIITGTFTIAVAIIRYALEVERNAELKRIELMQENYKNIIYSLKEYIRNNGSDNDALKTVYLESWIAGSEDVVIKIKSFMDKRSKQNLKNVLLQMRKDVGLHDEKLLDVPINDFTKTGGLEDD